MFRRKGEQHPVNSGLLQTIQSGRVGADAEDSHWLAYFPSQPLDFSLIPRQRLNTFGNIYNMMCATFRCPTCSHPNSINLESGLAQPLGKYWLSTG